MCRHLKIAGRIAFVTISSGYQPPPANVAIQPLGAFYRRLAARTDKPTAMTATARKLALLVYRMLKYNMPYHHTSAAEYDTRQRTRILRGLRKRATSLGFELVEASTGLVV